MPGMGRARYYNVMQCNVGCWLRMLGTKIFHLLGDTSWLPTSDNQGPKLVTREPIMVTNFCCWWPQKKMGSSLCIPPPGGPPLRCPTLRTCSACACHHNTLRTKQYIKVHWGANKILWVHQQENSYHFGYQFLLLNSYHLGLQKKEKMLTKVGDHFSD